MTPAQIQAFMEWVEARIAVAIEDHARRDSGQEMLTEIAAREVVYASFGFNENGTPLEPEEKPEPRDWHVDTLPNNPYRVGICNKNGKWWTWADGTVYSTADRRTAERKAKNLNWMDKL